MGSRWTRRRTDDGRAPLSGGNHREAVDAAAVLAIFNAVVRVADSTGISLEETNAETSAELRSDPGRNA